MQLTSSIEAAKYTGVPLEYPKFPMRFDRLDQCEMEEPPFLGEHTEDILHHTLEYSRAKIQDLKNNQVI